jgi:hypothetical protein
VPDEALKQARHGPLAVLLLLCGLILGAAAGPAAAVDAEGPSSRPAQSRPAKGLVVLRTAARDLALEEEGADDPPLLHSDARIVTRTLAVRQGQPYAPSDRGAPSGRPYSPYRARAPPAA